MQQELEILYQQPATIWEETFPIGNGRLGGMIWGTVDHEKIGLNDHLLWSGYPHEKKAPLAQEALKKSRELILKGERKQAQNLIEEDMEGEYTECYLPLGNLEINFGDESVTAKNYSRRLDLNHSTVEIDYENDLQKISREYFASYPDRAIFGRYTSDSNSMNLSFAFSSELLHQVAVGREQNCLLITGQCPEHADPHYVKETKAPIIQGTRGEKFSYRFNLGKTDGEITYSDDCIFVKNASEIEFYFCREEDAVEHDFYEAKQSHLKDYKRLFDRVDLYLGPQKKLPMDERRQRLRDGEADNGLIALYFQFGRYLLISSSRDEAIPANLQGIWNWQLQAPWSSNYTCNINAEMNYWLADSCNLSECFTPYSDFIQKLSVAGQKTAKEYYGLEGSVVHHNTDKWLTTNPVGKTFGHEKGSLGSAMWAYWPMGGVWYANDLYRHYEYLADEVYLKDAVYPVLKRSVTFLCNFLVNVAGTYHTIPSTSPENSFVDHMGRVISVDKSSTMDITMVKESFQFFKETCQKLDVEDEFLSRIAEIEDNLASIKIGSKGQILEYQEEFKEREPGHRHFSPLYGCYPGALFNSEELRKAALKTIEMRMANGGGHTGWSNAWVINLYAVLGRKEEAYQRIIKAIAVDSYPNLWGKHPPFQIDANFGVSAGIANLFVQDRNGEVKLLPALPEEFATGYVKGLRIKGNKQVDLTWRDGKLVEQKIYCADDSVEA